MTVPADRNLLFGLLALQNGMIDQSVLVAAFHAWTRDKSRSIAEILLGQGAIDADDRALLEGLVAKHLKRHGDDVEKSLAVRPGPALGRRPASSRLGDPNVKATLGHVASALALRPRTTTSAERRCHGVDRLGHRRRPAVPRPAAPRPRRPGGRLRRARRRAEPRGRAQADPRPPRRRPHQPHPVRPRSRDHRRARASGDRPGLRPGQRWRRPSLLRHAVHPRRQPQGRHRRLPRRSRR